MIDISNIEIILIVGRHSTVIRDINLKDKGFTLDQARSLARQERDRLEEKYPLYSCIESKLHYTYSNNRG